MYGPAESVHSQLTSGRRRISSTGGRRYPAMARPGSAGRRGSTSSPSSQSSSSASLSIIIPLSVSSALCPLIPSPARAHHRPAPSCMYKQHGLQNTLLLVKSPPRPHSHFASPTHTRPRLGNYTPPHTRHSLTAAASHALPPNLRSFLSSRSRRQFGARQSEHVSRSTSHVSAVTPFGARRRPCSLQPRSPSRRRQLTGSRAGRRANTRRRWRTVVCVCRVTGRCRRAGGGAAAVYTRCRLPAP